MPVVEDIHAPETEEQPEPLQAAATNEPDSFKTLIREFVMGDSQDPDSMPGLRFYVVFAVFLGLALGGVAVIALLLGFVNWLWGLF